MAEKDFGVKRINLIGASGTPTITSPNNLNINAVTVAISTDISIGGQVSSNLKISNGYSVGIGSTNPQQKLWVEGNGYFSGIVTASKFSGQLDAASGLAQKVGFATTATNLDGGALGSIPYQNSSGITSFLDGASVNNKVLLYNLATNKPYWGDASSAEGSFGGITVVDESTDTFSDIVTLNIFGSNISATSGGTGIASIRVNDNLVGTSLSISGVGTFSSGLEVIDSLSISSLQPGDNLFEIYNSSQNVVVAVTTTGNLGIATTNPRQKLWVEGNGYFSGVVTANKFVGDGSGLTSITAAANVSISTNTTNQTQYLTYVTGTGSTNGFGITTTGLVFNPFSGKFGIGLANPSAKLQVVTASSDGNVAAWGSGQLVLSPGGTSTSQGLAFSVDTSGGSASLMSLSPNTTWNPMYYRASSHIFMGSTGSDELGRFNTTGNFGIGTANPTAKLWVNGDGYFIGSVTSAQGFYVDGNLVGSGAISGGPLVGTGLSISGISTFGGSSGVVIKYENGAGILTSANPGVSTITYYGDGSNLTGVTGTKIVAQNLLSVPVYPTFANNTGVTSLGIAPDNFVYVPSTGRVGLGSTNPSFTLDINGDTRIRSENKLRFGGALDSSKFYIQYNSASNSLDFVAQ